MDLWHCARCLSQWHDMSVASRCWLCGEIGARGKIHNPCSGLAAARAVPAQRGNT